MSESSRNEKTESNSTKSEEEQQERISTSTLIQTLQTQIQSSPSLQLSKLSSSSSQDVSEQLQIFLDALSPIATSKARPLALLALSRLVAESASNGGTSSISTPSISSIFGPFLQQSRLREEENENNTKQTLSNRISITSLLTSISALDPNSSISLLSDPNLPTGESEKLEEVSDEPVSTAQDGYGFLSKLLFLSSTLDHESQDEESTLLAGLCDFSLAELISTLASSPSTRKLLIQDPLASKVQDFIQLHDKLKSYSNHPKDYFKSKTSLLTSLASLKIEKGSTNTDSLQPQTQSQSQSEKNNFKENSRKETNQNYENLFSSSRKSIIESSENSNPTSDFNLSICSKEFQSEISRTTILTSLESLSHLTLLKRKFREKVSKDEVLLKAIQKISGNKIRTKVFPTRAESGTKSTSGDTSTSSYDIDSRLSKVGIVKDGFRNGSIDSAIQYGIVSLVSNLVSYSHSKVGAENRKEQAQMRKLKEMANAKLKSKDGKEKEEEESEEDPNSMIDQRSTELISVGMVQTLVGILFTPGIDGKTSINPSSAIRKEVSKALYGLCVKQDRINRGKIIQEGGARALLSLGSLALLDYNQSFEKSFKDSKSVVETADLDLTASSALSLLLISHPPQLVLGAQSSISSALPLITALYLHLSSNDLQRFEAALALTNLSSMNENSAIMVSDSKPPKRVSEKGFLEGKKDIKEEGKEKDITIGNSLESLILLENNLMLRRANVELLCNLVSGNEELRSFWSGEKEDEEIEKIDKSKSDSNSNSIKNQSLRSNNNNSRSRIRIHALVAFSSPNSSVSSSLNEKENHNNISIPLRLASSGTLSSLTESSITCSHLFALGPKTLNHLVRLIDFTVSSDLKDFDFENDLEEINKIEEIVDDDEEKERNQREEKTDKSENDKNEDEDITQEEEIEFHLKELNSWPLGSDHALFSLNLRGLTIASSLSAYLSWRFQSNLNGSGANGLSSQGLTYSKEKEIFIRSGFEKSVRNLVKKGLLDLQGKGKIESKKSKEGNLNNELVNQIEGMKRQCIRMGMECLKGLKDIGITS